MKGTTAGTEGGDTTIRVAHSPDSDDAFMFFALAEGRIDTGRLRFEHQLQGIQELNERALRGELEVTAVSIHAYAYLTDSYLLLPHGASMGEGYGPRLVARSPLEPRTLRRSTIAVPGTLTSAHLALKLWEPSVRTVVLPFDRILEAAKHSDRLLEDDEIHALLATVEGPPVG
jgi:1,4-dihydroxy-6-naphthoate synthase